jgi:hypothetical protein
MRHLLAIVALGLAGCGAGGSEPPRRLPQPEPVAEAVFPLGSTAMVFHDGLDQDSALLAFSVYLSDRGDTNTGPVPGDRVRIVNDIGEECLVRFDEGPRHGTAMNWPKKWLKPITAP